MFISSLLQLSLLLWGNFYAFSGSVSPMLTYFYRNSFVSEFPLFKQLLMPNQEYIQDSAPLQASKWGLEITKYSSVQQLK